jgi:hypothetical protein
MWRNFDVNVDALLGDWENEYRDLAELLNEFVGPQILRIRKALNVPLAHPSTYKQTILSSPEYCFDLLTGLYFMNLNRKTMSRSLGVSLVGTRANETELLCAVMEAKARDDLAFLYLKYLTIKFGKGFFTYKLPKAPSEERILDLLTRIKSVSIALGQGNYDRTRYKLRFAVRKDNEAWFLLLRETADRLFPAIPNNKHVVMSKYILCHLNLDQQTLSINTRRRIEAAIIKNYSSKKLGVSIVYEAEEFEGDTETFFQRLLDVKGNKEAGLSLNKVEAIDTLSDLKMSLSGAHSIDEIANRLKQLKERKTVQLQDLSEFKSFGFNTSDGLNYSVRVIKDKWGFQRLSIGTSGKPSDELKAFVENFKKRFKIDFEKRIVTALNEEQLAQHILDKSRIDTGFPDSVEKVFLRLLKEKLIKAPTKSSKRRCVECQRISWAPGNCPSCARDMFILGEFLNIEFDELKSFNVLLKWVRSKSSESVSVRVKTIEKKKLKFIVIESEHEDPIWIYLSFGESADEIARFFEYVANPLIVFFMKHGKNNSDNLATRGVASFNLVEVVFRDPWGQLKKQIQRSREEFSLKRRKAAAASLGRLENKPKAYDDQDFEQDVFNLIHEIFRQGDKLGGRFTGVKAPDGVGTLWHKSSKKTRKLSIA